MAKKLQNLVGGKYVDPASGKYSDVINPSTEEVYANAPISGAEDVQNAFQVAHEAFKEWSQTTPSERQLALFRIADELENAIVRMVETIRGLIRFFPRTMEIEMVQSP